MEGYQLISYFLTNTIRVIVGVLLIVQVQGLQVALKKIIPCFIGIAVAITAIQGASTLQQYQLLGIEIILSLVFFAYFDKTNLRMSGFLLFFYELAISLWEFLISAALAILTGSTAFMNTQTMEYLAPVWGVRVLLLISALILYRGREKKIDSFRVSTLFAIITFFTMVTISEQELLPIDREITFNWMMMTVIFLFAIMIYKMGRQYEMEKELARLQAEQTELITNDYQNLNRIYTANAKLYHDLHNHMEMLHGYLSRDKVGEALEYLEDLRTPIQEITQTVWTGDEALDYLLNSKLAVMQKMQIAVKTNIEFPRNTNIRSVTLTTILGNLLDNAMEAALKCEEGQRFVHLSVRRINNILIIKVENSYREQPVTEAGELQSSKEDKQRHGWGLKSAKTAAESYDGSLETSFRDNVFCAVATLFF
ncbi:MAG: GHKL domain-containing protein [Lachnospiraceae bacterium]|nr:GHKL domain-containing protein [Lachnospiraceae bacterium]